jgi:hypothetical protein
MEEYSLALEHTRHEARSAARAGSVEEHKNLQILASSQASNLGLEIVSEILNEERHEPRNDVIELVSSYTAQASNGQARNPMKPIAIKEVKHDVSFRLDFINGYAPPNRSPDGRKIRGAPGVTTRQGISTANELLRPSSIFRERGCHRRRQPLLFIFVNTNGIRPDHRIRTRDADAGILNLRGELDDPLMTVSPQSNCESDALGSH